MNKGNVEKIILSRPAVEAGEQLRFLPGDIKEKIDPYLRPLYDALEDCMYKDKISKLLDREKIEIASCLYERKNFVKLLHYIRRGSKHNSNANENVFN